MPLGITPELEGGICSLCEKEKSVRLIIDNERNLVAKICLECAAKSILSAEEILEKHGKESKAAGKAEVLDKETWLREQGKGKPQSPS